MKRIIPNVAAMKARLEKNRESSRRPEISIHEHPLMRVAGPGTYKFRATYYPHSEDPAAEPFPVRYYHFGIPGGIVFCPAKNDGEPCAICEFVWDRMKEFKGQKEEVKKWADKLPKGRVWVPGKIRNYKDAEGNLLDRESEGVKFFSIGTASDKMSAKHEELYRWFYDDDTDQWLSPDKDPAHGGFDIEVEYAAYNDGTATGAAKAKMLNAEFGLEKISLSRKSTEFGADFEEFMDTIPNIDDNEINVLKSYCRKTSEQASEALDGWLELLKKQTKGQARASSFSEEADTSPVPDEAEVWKIVSEPTDAAPAAAPASDKAALKARLAKMGIK